MIPLLSWMNFIFPQMWRLGVSIYVDKTTIGFQGRHQYKRKIACKAEEGCFQGGAIFQDVFCYQFFFHNDPAPHKYINMGLSPLNTREMALFNTVYYEYHQYAMENLYDSAGFCSASYNHRFKVLCHGVMIKGGGGLPP